MEADQFRSALRTRPFKPFTVRTGSGAQYTVKHPETVGISTSGRTVVLALDEGSAVLDMASITDYVVTPQRRSKKDTGKEP
jgi:hypothetical protein